MSPIGDKNHQNIKIKIKEKIMNIKEMALSAYNKIQAEKKYAEKVRQEMSEKKQLEITRKSLERLGIQLTPGSFTESGGMIEIDGINFSIDLEEHNLFIFRNCVNCNELVQSMKILNLEGLGMILSSKPICSECQEKLTESKPAKEKTEEFKWEKVYELTEMGSTVMTYRAPVLNGFLYKNTTELNDIRNNTDPYLLSESMAFVPNNILSVI
jgi:hypothetical protein